MRPIFLAELRGMRRVKAASTSTLIIRHTSQHALALGYRKPTPDANTCRLKVIFTKDYCRPDYEFTGILEKRPKPIR